MNGAISTVVDELVKYKASSNKNTKNFVKLKHNKHLCPMVEKQGNRILDCFVKYHSVAYDVQGINDRGTDVLLRYLKSAMSLTEGLLKLSASNRKFQQVVKSDDSLQTSLILGNRTKLT